MGTTEITRPCERTLAFSPATLVFSLDLHILSLHLPDPDHLSYDASVANSREDCCRGGGTEILLALFRTVLSWLSLLYLRRG